MPERGDQGAYAVHFLTAFGAVTGLLALVAITEGEWHMAFVWMGAALAIDSVDGFMARASRVKERLPHFDGALLDNIVDYFTYAVVPAFFLWRAPLVPPGFGLPLGALIVLGAILVAPPVFLARAVGWPLPTRLPPLDQVRQALVIRQQLVE